ncbi:Nif11-like leader peptide family natural product precursor [Capilliphycus salinus ALCB114379]|uniref:Nif11-like leader peptide family natural product precursor n=1 Tax=Capilliphycus salinus TaxID=2768948 RepID=UPI0039A50459
MRPINILENVKDFLVRLVKDKTFREQVENNVAEQVQQLLQANGYSFSQEEFETASIQLLDLKERDEFHELTEAELVGAIGGLMKKGRRSFSRPIKPIDDPIVQPMYGVIVEPIDDPINPIDDPIVQPMYGVVIEPIDDGMIFQSVYGVIVDWMDEDDISTRVPGNH